MCQLVVDNICFVSTYGRQHMLMYREESEVDTSTTYVVCRHIVVNICQDVLIASLCPRAYAFPVYIDYRLCVNTLSTTYVLCRHMVVNICHV